MRHVRTVVVIALLAGCKGKPASESNEEAEDKEATATFVKPTAAELAAGRKLATVPSLPRKDWPTGTVEYGRESLTVMSRGTFTYDSDEPCTLPVLAHEEGIVGCPSAYAYGDYKDVFKYDAKRRFLGRDGTQYKWVDDGLEKLSAMDITGVTTTGANLAALSLLHQSYHRHFQVEKGRLLASYRTRETTDLAKALEKPEATLTWGATRLEYKQMSFSRTYFEYADTPVTKRPEDLELEKREAADHDAAALALVSSVPRKDWPCEAVTTFADGDGRRIVFSYDKRAGCRLAAELHAEGVVGCPASAVVHEKKADGSVVEPQTLPFRYDGDLMVAGILSHRKRGDGLLAARGTFEKTEKGVTDKSDDYEIQYSIADGRTQRIGTYGGGLSAEVDLTWEAGRLAKIAGEILGMKRTTVLSYDCK